MKSSGLVVAVDERPVHVRVAEALGCSPVEYGVRGGFWKCGCRGGHAHGQEYTDGYVSEDLRRYDADWMAVGEIIEEYRVQLCSPRLGSKWRAELPPRRGGIGLSALGDTPHLAVCHLILALKDSGRL